MLGFIYQMVNIIDILVQHEPQYIMAVSIRRIVVYLHRINLRAANIIVGSGGIHGAAISHHHLIDTRLKAALCNKTLGIGSFNREIKTNGITQTCSQYHPSSFLSALGSSYTVVIIYHDRLRLPGNIKIFPCSYVVNQHGIGISVSQFPEIFRRTQFGRCGTCVCLECMCRLVVVNIISVELDIQFLVFAQIDRFRIKSRRSVLDIYVSTGSGIACR